MSVKDEWMAECDHPEYGPIRFKWRANPHGPGMVYTIKGRHMAGSLTIQYEAEYTNTGELRAPDIEVGRIKVRLGAPQEPKGKVASWNVSYTVDPLTIHNAQLQGAQGAALSTLRARNRFDLHFHYSSNLSNSTRDKFEAIIRLAAMHWLTLPECLADREASVHAKRKAYVKSLEQSLADTRRDMAKRQAHEAELIAELDAVTADQEADAKKDATESELSRAVVVKPTEPKTGAPSAEKPPAHAEPEPDAVAPEREEIFPEFPVLAEPVPVRRKRLAHLLRQQVEHEKNRVAAERTAARYAKSGHQDVHYQRKQAEEFAEKVKECMTEVDAIEASGVTLFARGDIKVGGLVLEGREWFEVGRVNPQSVTVTDPHRASGSIRQGMTVYAFVKGHTTQLIQWARIEDYHAPGSPEALALLGKTE